MAFPTTVSTLVEPYHGLVGPYVSSTNNVYIVTRSNASSDIQVFKASDPSTSFAGAGSLTMTSGNTVRAIAGYQVGDNIHIVTRDAAATNSNQIRYHVYSMASDTFTTSNTLVRDTYTAAGAVDESNVDIVVRSDGDVIVMYEGPQVLADIQRKRIYYARHLGAAWSADIALDNGGNAHWIPGGMVRGSADRIHFFFKDETNNDAYQRALTSADVLESFPASFDVSIGGTADDMMQRGAAYSASAGGTLVVFPYFNSFTPDVNSVAFTSVDAPVPVVTTDIASATEIVANFRHAYPLAVDDKTVYFTFHRSASGICINTNVDNAGWGSATAIQAGSASYIFTNIYTRNSAKVLAVAYKEDSSTKYTEYTLSVAASTTQPLLTLAMMGAGR